jgi:multidrug efflux system membrane fusion protein
VVQAGNREIQIFVPENRLGTIAPNMPCQVTFWALQNTTAQGYIRDIAPMADPNTKTYKVRVALPDMPEAARLGMTAKVTLGSVRATQLLLPRAALYQTGDKTEVWVVKAGKVHLQDVTIGNYQDDSVVITKGLTEGDIVVTGGISKLQDNMEVRLEGGVAQ